MRRVACAICCCFVLLLLAGCCSTRQYVPFPDQGKGLDNPERSRVYLITSVLNPFWASEVKDGDQRTGKIGRGEDYLCWERDPGRMTINTGGAWIHLYARKGCIYYLHYGVPGGQGDPWLIAVSADDGRACIQNRTPAPVMPPP